MSLRSILLAALGALALSASADTDAAAGGPGVGLRERVLVELFSSRACESCAPAHRLIGELARRPDVIVLTFPVDYWNYLQPEDDLAKPEFTARQRAYSRALGRHGLYTPQIVVQGVQEASGAERATVEDVIAGARRAPAGPAIALEPMNGALTVRIGADGRARSPAQVWLARFSPGPADFAAEASPYHNAATGLERLGVWAGGRTEFRTAQCDEACVVIVQDGIGRVLAARTWSAGR